jgi:FAD/FMN-containing dehydrogenase
MDTDGHRYDSDAQQFGFDLSGYHQPIDRERGHLGCELIIELSVPRPVLPTLLARAATLCRRRGIEIIYGTVRLIRADHETRLPWAREHFACTVFNLHVRKSRSGLAKARADQQALTDLALELDGSFYLTYDRYYSRAQLLRAYPRMPEVLEAQRRGDPDGRFSSQFHRYLRELLG